MTMIRISSLLTPPKAPHNWEERTPDDAYDLAAKIMENSQYSHKRMYLNNPEFQRHVRTLSSAFELSIGMSGWTSFETPYGTISLSRAMF